MHIQSQSPQTGQVYFNKMPIIPSQIGAGGQSQSPQTGQVYFNSIPGIMCVNKWCGDKSQSPQTGQVYFNKFGATPGAPPHIMSQSPQTGQVYFNLIIMRIMVGSN